jgi:hypothetical protein
VSKRPSKRTDNQYKVERIPYLDAFVEDKRQAKTVAAKHADTNNFMVTFFEKVTVVRHQVFER